VRRDYDAAKAEARKDMGAVKQEARKDWNIAKTEAGKRLEEAKDQSKEKASSMVDSTKRTFKDMKDDVKDAASRAGSGLMGTRREDMPRTFPSPDDFDVSSRGEPRPGLLSSYKEKIIDAAAEDRAHDFLPGTGRGDSYAAHFERARHESEPSALDSISSWDMGKSRPERSELTRPITASPAANATTGLGGASTRARDDFLPGIGRGDSFRIPPGDVKTRGDVESVKEKAPEPARSWISSAENTARDATERAYDKTKSAVESVKEKASEVGHDIKEKVSDTTQKIKSTAEDVKEKAVKMVQPIDRDTIEREKESHRIESEKARRDADKDRDRMYDSDRTLEDRARAAGSLAANKAKETYHDLNKK
jgi:hypothetical protein